MGSGSRAGTRGEVNGDYVRTRICIVFLFLAIQDVLGRVCEGGPRVQLRSWAATYRVCGVDPRGGLAPQSQKSSLSLAL
jgi:hypothetical protein